MHYGCTDSCECSNGYLEIIVYSLVYYLHKIMMVNNNQIGVFWQARFCLPRNTYFSTYGSLLDFTHI